MPNRSVTFTGIKFDNPFLLSSAPPTESESNILRAFESGWGGVVVKTSTCRNGRFTAQPWVGACCAA